jgi:uncharacterized protein YcfL
MKKLLILTIFLLNACSSPQGNHLYVSEKEYEGYTCQQLEAEMSRLSSKIEQSLEAQKEQKSSSFLETAVTVYSISQGYNPNNSTDEQTKRLQASYDIVEKMIIQKGCL